MANALSRRFGSKHLLRLCLFTFFLVVPSASNFSVSSLPPISPFFFHPLSHLHISVVVDSGQTFSPAHAKHRLNGMAEARAPNVSVPDEVVWGLNARGCGQWTDCEPKKRTRGIGYAFRDSRFHWRFIVSFSKSMDWRGIVLCRVACEYSQAERGWWRNCSRVFVYLWNNSGILCEFCRFLPIDRGQTFVLLNWYQWRSDKQILMKIKIDKKKAFVPRIFSQFFFVFVSLAWRCNNHFCSVVLKIFIDGGESTSTSIWICLFLQEETCVHRYIVFSSVWECSSIYKWVSSNCRYNLKIFYLQSERKYVNLKGKQLIDHLLHFFPRVFSAKLYLYDMKRNGMFISI